ncbi:MAG: hypothetical protein KC457_33385, partial [Myxococcales bacterium]|nr:hypothetical protein [Myxococcales bacterium]
MRKTSLLVATALLLAACPSDNGGTADEIGSESESSSSDSSGDTTSDTTESTDTIDVIDTETDTGPVPFCGDGNVDPGEDCDDGNDVDGDACTNDCIAAACGD